jgi:hypothetical protein
MERAPSSEPPRLVTTLEAVANAMGIVDGRLELVYERSKLTRWFFHSERKHAGDMREFDADADAELNDRARPL